MFNKIKNLALNYNGEARETILNLLKDEKCFYKMDIDTTYNILKTIGVSESEINKVVIELLKEKIWNIKQ